MNSPTPHVSHHLPASPFKRLALTLLWAVPLSGILLPLLTHAPHPAVLLSKAPRTVIIGGGPDLNHNQVGIESNVRYVSRLLPEEVTRTILFADGNTQKPTVQYQEQAPTGPPIPSPKTAGERAFNLLFGGDDEGKLKYRPPRIQKIDGPAERETITNVFTQLRRELTNSARPVLLYFTGHGSISTAGPPVSEYDLWGGQAFTVQDMARELKKVPDRVPVALVMVQCFSGGFGNLLFENGQPNGSYIDRDFAGYFASTPDRMSAGCTPTVDESEYKDFTSYFFAALSGTDRVGRKITGVDYNHDGRVGMDEAYAYSLAADESIDVPVCTSDVFLRRFVPASDRELFQSPWSSVVQWAKPAQRAALESLTQKLKMTGENRLAVAYAEMQRMPDMADDSGEDDDGAGDPFEGLRNNYRDSLTRRFPALSDPKSSGYAAARDRAVQRLDRMAKAGFLNDLFKAAQSYYSDDSDEGTMYSLRGSRLLRFVRLGKSVILAHRLTSSKDEKLLARWKRLQEAEGRSPIQSKAT